MDKLTPASFLIITDVDQNQVLTIQRTDMRIGFIGGKLEGYETPREAMVREVYEEAGLEVGERKTSYLGVWILPDRRHVHYYHLAVNPAELVSLSSKILLNSLRGYIANPQDSHLLHREILGINITPFEKLIDHCEGVLMPTMVEVMLALGGRKPSVK